ncbi:MAG TPA: S9 family peptidase [Acidobacteriota bacterium]|nr:S9 family peptidase [Acidobacteriota bacterium]
MSVDDALRLKRLGNVLLSPDGERVFYSVSELDWDENERRTRYFMVPFSGGEARQYIGDAGGRSFRFSPDGDQLTFLRDVDDEAQVFGLPTGGGEARQLTAHKGGVEAYRWSPDGSAIFFSAEETRSDDEQREHDLGFDPVFVDEAPNGKHEARFSNLWVHDMASDTETRLTNQELIVGAFDISPDGGQVVFTARPDDRTNYPFLSEMYLYERVGSRLTRLTDNSAPEDDPQWAPDGGSILYRAPSDAGFDLSNGYFWIMDVASQTARRLDGQNQGEVDNVAWTADGTGILFNENRGTDTNLYRLDIGSGDVTALTDRVGTMRSRAFSADRRRAVFSYENFTTPADLWALHLDGGEPTRLTNVNPVIGDTIGVVDGEVLSWPGKNDMRIEGVFMNALDHQPGDPQPLIVHIHGGPAGVVTNRFDAEFQTLAGLGYAILAPNVRGSSGYGDEVLRGLMGEVGDGELIDMMAGLDYTIANRDIDPERLGVRGWSWGGVATSYTITQTNRFKAASVGAMVGNWAAETGPGFNFDVSLWYIGDSPWSQPEEWAKRSAITHVSNVTTPTIIFHGARDETSSVGQSLMFFTALRDIGKAPVRYVKFPRQGHGIEEPRLERVYLVEEIRWFKKHIEGVDWEPSELPEKAAAGRRTGR